MYTQCPDCATAFRITAEVLRQAAGKVRCGGCSNAFNALDYLSEDIPEQRPSRDSRPLPSDLTPERDDNAGAPKSVSVTRNAALLKTLDELAGSDVQLEDTGVEWRILDEQDANNDDDEFASTSGGELRFDDNTPLPDDFGVDNATPASPQAPEASAAGNAAPDLESPPGAEAAQQSVALSDPDEWADILGEFVELADDISAPLAAELDALENTPDADTDERSENRLSDDPDDEFAEQLAELEQAGELQEPVVEQRTIEDELAALATESSAPGEEEPEAPADGTHAEHYVPPMSEEEQTVNMMIDEELMALAIQDNDGFASTMVIPENDANGRALKEAVAEDGTPEIDIDSSFESIVMEGETARLAHDEEKLAADIAAAAELLNQAAANAAEPPPPNNRMRHAIIGGVVVLVLALALQLMHQSREALATIPAFNKAVGPIYRALGQPLQPDWDVTGWRFEATKGSAQTDAQTVDENLTIYSRIGNKSEQALPYPLINVWLTDRFEETIGSRTLEPAEYLSNDLDPRELVQPGNSFNAVISIQSPAAEATGFKLNVCYRLADGQLRCATDDFK